MATLLTPAWCNTCRSNKYFWVLVAAVISQKAKYALRALLELARAAPGAPTQISDVATAQAIPKKFLEQILLDLKNHGIVASRRGKSGGYSLLKHPSEVTFGQILRLVDGPIAPLPCLSRIAYRRCSDCTNEAECEIRRVFARVADATRDVLDGTTLADAIGGKAPIDIHTHERLQLTEPAI